MSKLYGEHAVTALLGSSHAVDACIYIESSKQTAYQSILKQARSQHTDVKIIPSLNDLFPKARHQGIGATFQFQFGSLQQLDFASPLRLLMLDRIQDPHNFGACMRSAAAFGVDAVITPQRGQAPINEIVHQVSCGGSLIVPIIQVNNLSQTISELKDQRVWFIASCERADQEISDIAKDSSLCLVMGSEGEGLKQKLFEACDYRVSIKTSPKLPTLNVSVATGILLHELANARHTVL